MGQQRTYHMWHRRGYTLIPRSRGTLFAPVKSDVTGNVTKLQGWYDKDPSKDTLEKLLQTEIEQNTTQAAGSATDALLWLKRGLWMMAKFMQSMLNGRAIDFSVWIYFFQVNETHPNHLLRHMIQLWNLIITGLYKRHSLLVWKWFLIFKDFSMLWLVQISKAIRFVNIIFSNAKIMHEN